MDGAGGKCHASDFEDILVRVGRWTLFAGPALAQEVAPAHSETVKRIVDSQSFKAAADALQKDHDRWISEVIKLTEIPAPPFKEQERGKAYMEMLKAHGLTDVEIDAEGNAMGVRKGTGGGPLVVVSAHLDTVFPEGTDVKVKRDGSRLAAPGSATTALVSPRFSASSGPWMRPGSRRRATSSSWAMSARKARGTCAACATSSRRASTRTRSSTSSRSMAAARPTITNCGVGSKRYRVTFKGPGGHSFQAFGLVNPMTAMAQTVVEFYKIQTPTQPKTTYAASVTGGGTSVNSIPNEVWMEFDMRSVDAKELDRLEKRFLSIVNQSLETENFARSTKEGPVSADIKLIGDGQLGKRTQAGHRADCHGGLPGEWNPTRLRMRLDRFQHADEPRHPSASRSRAPARRTASTPSMSGWIPILRAISR